MESTLGSMPKTARYHAQALEFFSFSTARNNRDFAVVMINW